MTEEQTKLLECIDGAVRILARFDKGLASMFEDTPHSRMNIAQAFAVGLVKNAEDDIHPAAALVYRVAVADRDYRANEARREALRDGVCVTCGSDDIVPVAEYAPPACPPYYVEWECQSCGVSYNIDQADLDAARDL